MKFLQSVFLLLFFGVDVFFNISSSRHQHVIDLIFYVPSTIFQL